MTLKQTYHQIADRIIGQASSTEPSLVGVCSLIAIALFWVVLVATALTVGTLIIWAGWLLSSWLWAVAGLVAVGFVFTVAIRGDQS